jgi:hypothetical protein
VSDVIIFQDDQKRFYCLNGFPKKVSKKVSKKPTTNVGCRLCQSSDLNEIVFRKRTLQIPGKGSGPHANSNSQSSSRRGTLSTNVSIETNVGELKNIDKIIDTDVKVKNVERRSSEPVASTMDAKPLQDSKVLSNSFAFDDDKKFSAVDRAEHLAKFPEDKNPVKRIPTQVSKICFSAFKVLDFEMQRIGKKAGKNRGKNRKREREREKKKK